MELPPLPSKPEHHLHRCLLNRSTPPLPDSRRNQPPPIPDSPAKSAPSPPRFAAKSAPSHPDSPAKSAPSPPLFRSSPPPIRNFFFFFFKFLLKIRSSPPSVSPRQPPSSTTSSPSQQPSATPSSPLQHRSTAYSGRANFCSVHTPLNLTEDEWNDTIKTNMTGTWLVSKHVCKRMCDARHGGSVINISSIAGLNRGQLPGSFVYAASKTAVNAMTKIMALEFGEYKIRVNSISPGLFKSEITQGLMQKDWLTNVAKKTVPLRTFGESDPALTSLARYLIHDSSQYVTGNVFIVEAGATLTGIPIFSSL